jgi:hypothetical protein
MNPEMAVMSASLQQQHAVAAGRSEPVGENAARGAGTHDDVVEIC